ncbi:MAG: DUF3160 domain-containing protein [Deltaproteobacteria bacterium]|nr:DUF3160 domain-containing protein [Deltaproteobacteria bacterium]
MSRSTLLLVPLVLLAAAGCRKPAPEPTDRDAAGPPPVAAADAPSSVEPDAEPPPPGPLEPPVGPPESAAMPRRGGRGAPSGFEQFHTGQPPAYRAAGTPPALPIPDALLRADPVVADGRLAARGLDDAALARLARLGFVVLTHPQATARDDYGDAFQGLQRAEIPLYVSADAALHLYHLAFDALLMRIETEHLAGLLGRLLDGLRERARTAADDAGTLGEAALANLAFLDTARRLLDPDAVIDDRVRETVEGETALVAGRSGPAPSPVFGYEEDYTPYVVRGHYTRTEALRRYFRTMMWLGRMSFQVRAREDPEPAGNVPLELARRLAVQSLQLVEWLREAQVDGTAALHAWSRIYRVTAFFAGFADDLTPLEVSLAAERALAELWSVAMLDGPEAIDRLRLRIVGMRVPALLTGTGRSAVQAPPEQLDDRDRLLAAGAGLRLFGQRYTPDAELMSRLTYPAVGRHTGSGTPFTLVQGAAGPVRGFARGLDVMAGLGAPTARDLLRQLGDDAYAGYDDALAAAAGVFPPAGQAAWRSTLYWAWLDVLRELVAPTAPPTQAFQTTPAWSGRLLSSALASWAVLRHDTILYVKQPYVPKGVSARRPVGLVEPCPEVFARLAALSRMTRRALIDLKLVADGSAESGVLGEFEDTFARLAAIAVAEVEDRPLDAQQRQELAGFADTCRQLLDRVAGLFPADEDGVPAADLRPTLVADVMTNPEAGEVLEEASGPLELLLVVAREPGSNELFVAGGPVASYFEFRRPVGQRLTDEGWRALPASPDAPPPPSWTCDWRTPCAVAPP